MKTLQTVIDTSVLVAAARSRRGASYRLLRLFAERDTRWQWNVSTAMLIEYEAVLKREQHRLEHDLPVVDRLVDDIAARGNRHTVFFLIRPFLSDPGDEFVMELAVASGSEYLVTHNRDDFREASRFGVGVVTPGEFLRIIGETT
jgi:predicted nucleic acid-binding protein